MRLDTHREFPLVKGNRRLHHEARLGAALRILYDEATYVHVIEQGYLRTFRGLESKLGWHRDDIAPTVRRL